MNTVAHITGWRLIQTKKFLYACLHFVISVEVNHKCTHNVRCLPSALPQFTLTNNVCFCGIFAPETVCVIVVHPVGVKQHDSSGADRVTASLWVMSVLSVMVSWCNLGSALSVSCSRLFHQGTGQPRPTTINYSLTLSTCTSQRQEATIPISSFLLLQAPLGLSSRIFSCTPLL